jgi:hypothetical protein
LSLPLREENRLRVFENRIPKEREVTGGWRTLHNEELHNLYYSPNIIREKGSTHHIHKMRNASKMLVRKYHRR